MHLDLDICSSRQRSGLEIQIQEPLVYTGGAACHGAEENE